jgi:hypothetical protein
MTQNSAHLQDNDEKEVEVGHAVELLIQVQWQEGEDVVLGRVDGIALEGESPTDGMWCCPGPGSLWPTHSVPASPHRH